MPHVHTWRVNRFLSLIKMQMLHMVAAVDVLTSQ